MVAKLAHGAFGTERSQKSYNNEHSIQNLKYLVSAGEAYQQKTSTSRAQT